MAFTNEPLVYFGNNSDFEANYNYTADENRNKQAVFVGDTHMIYTHGVAFNGNDTVYNDGELRGLIGGLQDQDETINGQIETLQGLVEDVQGDLLGLHDWSQEDIDGRIQALISDAQWLQENFPVDEIFTQSNFGEEDVKEYLQLVGLINIDENTGDVTTTWSTFQQSYNSLESRVDQLEQNELDVEGLETRLHQYILNDTAIADLTSKWFWSHDGDIEWALAGLKTATNNAESFASVWSTMDKAINGDSTQGTAGLVTKVSDLENNMVAKTELGTLVSQEGFATTAGTVAKSDLDGSVAALFSLTSSTNTAVNNKLAGVITSSNLDNSVATLLASNGTGSASAVSTYVNNWWSGVTIAANKIDVFGDQINIDGSEFINITGNTAVDGEIYSYGSIYAPNINGQNMSLTSRVVVYDPTKGINNAPRGGMSFENGPLVYTDIKFDEIVIGNNVFADAQGENHDDYFDEDARYTTIKDSYITSSAKNSDSDWQYSYIGVDGIILGGDTNNNIGRKDISKMKQSATVFIENSSAYGGRIELSNYTDGYATVTINGDGTGQFVGSVEADSFDQSSDKTLKDIISDTTLTVEQVADAPAVNFTWKKDAEKENKKLNVGTIAQYWQVVLPEVVGEAKDGTLTFQYGNAAMVSSIVTAKEVVALKEEIAELKRQIAELKAN